MKREPKIEPIAHESETQRQYIRVRIPGQMAVEDGEHVHRFPLHDLSAGGVAFNCDSQELSTGPIYEGRVEIEVDGVYIGIPVSFRVLRQDDDGRCGACFENMGSQESSALRQIITAFVGGELISVGEMLHTLNRNNFTAPRKPKPAVKSRRNVFRAAYGTAMALLVGLAATWYAGNKLYDYFLMASTNSAHVAGPTHVIAMPREGVFHSLIPDDGVVEQGAPIASFETPMLNLVRTEAMSANLSPQRINELLEERVKGTITSPCDCVVKTQLVPEGQYVGQGEAILELAPQDFKPHVVAGFSFAEAQTLTPQSPVAFRIAGDHRTYHGEVMRVRNAHSSDGVRGDVVVTIAPDDQLTPQMISRPAKVYYPRWQMVANALDKLPSAFANGE